MHITYETEVLFFEHKDPVILSHIFSDLSLEDDIDLQQ